MFCFFRPIGGDELASYQGVEIKKEAGTSGSVLGICFELQYSSIATLFADFWLMTGFTKELIEATSKLFYPNGG